MKRLGLLIAAAGACTYAFAWAPPAAAQSHALNRFDPAPAGDRLFGVQSANTMGHLELHASLTADYAHNPLTLTLQRGVGDVGSIVENQLFLHLNASFALWNRLSLGLEMPFALAQGGGDQTFMGTQVNAPSGAAVSDLRFHAKGTFYGERGGPFSIGLGAYLWVPSGERNAFVSDGTVRGSAQLLLEGTANRFYWNFATGPQFRKAKQLVGVNQGTMYNWSAGVGVLLGDDKEVQLGPEVNVNINVDDPQWRNTNGELLLGAKYHFADYFMVGAAAGPGFTKGVGTPDVRALATFGVSPMAETKRKDRDRDGVLDHVDACPDRAGVSSDDPDKHGCPPPTVAPEPPPVDGDGDGIEDAKDACVGVAGVAHADASKNGCPADTDGDGVPDSQDACPTTAVVPPAEADPAKPGCPAADSDGDGIVDHRDACPSKPGVASTDSAKNGCPGDQDADGVTDDVDACPGEPGIRDDDASKNGCPHKVALKGKDIVILEQVQFETGRSTIKAVSNALLDEVAEVLKSHTEITKVEVAGHTDNAGSAALNRRLSKDRAAAVRKALIARGIDGARLITEGYGPDKPIATNDTDEGRAKNRRVQFTILEQGEGETK